MHDVPTLTEQDHQAILSETSPFFCPDPTGIKKGDRFHLWAKVGGEQQLVSVIVGTPPYRKGKAATYVDVYGYGLRKSVNVKKLLQTKPQPGQGIVDM